MPITVSIALYCTAWALLLRSARQRRLRPPGFVPWLLAAALCFHGYGLYTQIVQTTGYHLSLFKILSLFFWTTNLLVLASSLRQPLHNLFLITLPLAALALISSLVTTTSRMVDVSRIDLGTALHIFLSIIAYSTMILATAQALTLAWQNYKIRHKHPGGLVRLLPPLQTMEALLFEMLWIGEVLLTLVIVSGMTSVYSVAGQHLHHKIVFTIIAWVTYGILLWGRHAKGWRGNYAIRWTLIGFGFLVLAYVGSKLVLEIVLGIG